MTEITKWLDLLQCPDCQSSSVVDKDSTGQVSCTRCGRIFECSQGIRDFLPTSVASFEDKEKEKQGWTVKSEKDVESGWDPPPEHYLALPDYPHPYYEAAAWYLKIVLEYGKPWTGKKALELGAAECWGTRHFAEAGADAAALDYDPTRMVKGQILLDRLPIRFIRLTGDAECLPFGDNTLDRIFCCSVLHHFFDLPRAVREISRTLRPGGVFFGIHEAYHPPYFSNERTLAMSEDTVPNIEVGINEGSYTSGYYRKLFRKAGLEFEFINPAWDTRWEGSSLVVKQGAGLYCNPDYVPGMFSGRSGRKSLIGLIARLLLHSRVWRIAANPVIFPLIRFQVLNWSQKERIIVAKKPE